MFSRICTKTVILLLVASFLVPSAIFFYPTSAKAEIVSCAARAGMALGLISANSAAAALVAVPTQDISNKAAFTISATSNLGEFFGDCILKPLAIRLANAMLFNMTTSIVNWINTGFHGNPFFVQDLNSLLTDAADQAIGQFLEHDLGAGFLCQPFALQVRVAIAQSYLPYRERTICTLSQIKYNVDGFIEGDNSGGWDNWLQVTTVPQNNMYGATILAQDELSKRLIDLEKVRKEKLSWSNGFLEVEVCTVAVDPETGMATLDAEKIPPNDPRCRDRKTNSPGRVVEQQLVNAMGSDMRRLEIAQDLDAIIGALATQLTSQIIGGAKGLLGAGKNSNGSYRSTSYQAAISGNINDQELSEAIDQGITESVQDFNIDEIFGGEALASTTATTTSSGETIVIPPGPAILSLDVVSSSGFMDNNTPFMYEVDLTSNKSASNLLIKTSLKKNDVFIAFNTIFWPLQLTYGRSDNNASQYVITSTDATRGFAKVSVDSKTPFIIKYTGTKKSGAPVGTYTIETTVSDDKNNVLKTQSDSFIVQ